MIPYCRAVCRYVTERARVPRIGVAYPTLSLEALVDADLDTLVTALSLFHPDLGVARHIS
jgi:hypothetical protein